MSKVKYDLEIGYIAGLLWSLFGLYILKIENIAIANLLLVGVFFLIILKKLHTQSRASGK